MVVAVMSGIGTAMQYLDKLSYIVRMCLFPSEVVGRGPTVSKDTSSKVSIGVSVFIIGS